MSVIGKRLNEARLRAGLSQERLGVLCGIDEMSASARMNQYERGVHTPGYDLVEQFAKVLGLPIEYFYSKDDDIAKLLLAVNELTPEYKIKVFENIRTMLEEQNKPKPETEQEQTQESGIEQTPEPLSAQEPDQLPEEENRPRPDFDEPGAPKPEADGQNTQSPAPEGAHSPNQVSEVESKPNSGLERQSASEPDSEKRSKPNSDIPNV